MQVRHVPARDRLLRLTCRLLSLRARSTQHTARSTHVMHACTHVALQPAAAEYIDKHVQLAGCTPPPSAMPVTPQPKTSTHATGSVQGPAYLELQHHGHHVAHELRVWVARGARQLAGPGPQTAAVLLEQLQLVGVGCCACSHRMPGCTAEVQPLQGKKQGACVHMCISQRGSIVSRMCNAMQRHAVPCNDNQNAMR